MALIIEDKKFREEIQDGDWDTATYLLNSMHQGLC
jgi:hypothetical protein